jgi:exopolysaccharide biosynthesis protein
MAFLLCVCACTALGAPARAAVLQKITLASDADNVRVVLHMDKAVAPSAFALSGPPRIVADLPGTVLAVASAAFPMPAIAAGETDLRGIRVGQFSTDTARVVLDLGRSMPVRTSVDEKNNTVELILSRSAGPAPPATPTETKAPSTAFNEGTTQEEVRPGVLYTRVAKKRAAGPLIYHVLDLDPADPRIRIALVQGKGYLGGLEALSGMAQWSGAAFAVNGGYFNMQTGEPFDMVVADGLVVTRPDRYRGFFGMDKTGRPVFSKPTVTLSVAVGGRPAYYVSHLNRAPGKGSVGVFDRRFGKHTGTADYRTEFIVDNGKVTDMIKGGNAAIPENGFVISLDDKQWEKFGSKIKIGDTADLHITGNPDPSAISCGVSAGPMLVSNGAAEKYLIEDFGRDSGIVAGRAPRTAAGVTHNGRLRLVVVEGRSSISIGATLAELAEIMVSLGCISAINLDGGGSSEMIVDGHIKNNLNGAERKLANAFVVFFDAPGLRQ